MEARARAAAPYALVAGTLALVLAAVVATAGGVGCGGEHKKRSKHRTVSAAPTSIPEEDPPPAPRPPPREPDPAPPPKAAPPAKVHATDEGTPAPVAVKSFRARQERPKPAEPAHEKESHHGPISDCTGGSKEGSGDRYAVHGVDRSDVLNLRERADPKSTIVGELAPDATGIVDLGEERQVGPSSWRKVKCGKFRGWANARFLARESGK